MKKGMKMPGFTADASVYKSNGHYMMAGVPGEITKPLVSTAAVNPYIFTTRFLIDWYFGGNSIGGVGDTSYAFCRANCINKDCMKVGMSAEEIARCISACESKCRQ